MLTSVKSWVKETPAVYDFLKGLKGRYGGARTGSAAYLDAFSRALGRPVRFIQIGANDGLRNDPIRAFVLRDRWTGVLVEPLPHVFPRLKRNYAGRRFGELVFVNAAVSATGGEALSFWSYDEDFLARLPLEQRLDFLRKASFDRRHVARFLAEAGYDEQAIVEIRVPTVTVAALAERHFPGGAFDLLVIDAEGHEATILSSVDFRATRPRAIFYESHHLGADKARLQALLGAAGYAVRDIGGDSVAELPRAY